MKLCRIAVCGLCAFFCLLSPMTSKAEDKQQEERKDQPAGAQERQRPVEQKNVVYIPPSPSVISKPGGRVGGSSRGSETGDLTFFVVAPEDHTGLTTQEQPVLSWYMSQPTSASIVFTLVTDQADKPLVEKSLGIPAHVGLQHVRLTDYGVRLFPGVHYKWSITLVADPQQPSKNLLAEGAIEYIEPSPLFRTQLVQASKRDIPRLYAAEGFWYDAMSALADLLEASHSDAWLRRQRASLSQQVELPEVD